MPVVLYERQRQIIDYIAQFIQKNSFAPSLRDMADAMNLNSLATVHEHIKILVRKGVLKKTGTRRNRGYEIVDERLANQDKGVRLPILGFIAAGKPIEPYSDPEAYLHVAPTMVSGKKRSYVLQVRGDSMIEEGIFDGDYVVVEEDESVKNGDIVVALLETGLATLKKFFKEATRIRLEPANAQMAPIFASKVQIQGRVVAVIRKF